MNSYFVTWSNGNTSISFGKDIGGVFADLNQKEWSYPTDLEILAIRKLNEEELQHELKMQKLKRAAMSKKIKETK